MVLARSFLLTAVALPMIHAADYFRGDGTAYTLSSTNVGNCNMMKALPFASHNYAALNNEQWGNLEGCGRCAEVSCDDARCADKSKTELIQILDRCPECAFGALDLSPTVFQSITGSSPSRYKIKWRFVDCPVSGNIHYCLKEGSNPFWIAIQPTNVVSGVSSLSINGQKAKQLGSAYYFLQDSGGQGASDLSSVRTTIQSINGESITETVSLKVGACTEGQHQFGKGGSGGNGAQTPSNQQPATTASPQTQAPAATTKPAATMAATTAPPKITIAPPKTMGNATIRGTTPSPQAEAGATTASSVASDADASTAGSTSVKDKDSTAKTSVNMKDVKGSQESDVMGTVAPATSATPGETDAPQTSEAPGVSEVTTRNQGTSGSTSPMIIALSAMGAVAGCVLVAMAVVARRNKLADEDKEDYIDDFMRQGSSMASAEGIVTINHGVL